MLSVRVRNAVDPRNQLEAGTSESGDLGAGVQEAKDQLDRVAPPLGHRDHVSGFVIGIAYMKGDQGMTAVLQHPSQLAVRGIAVLLVEVDDRIETDNCRCRSCPDRQRGQISHARRHLASQPGLGGHRLRKVEPDHRTALGKVRSYLARPATKIKRNAVGGQLTDHVQQRPIQWFVPQLVTDFSRVGGGNRVIAPPSERVLSQDLQLAAAVISLPA